jgi:hypothetical protein
VDPQLRGKRALLTGSSTGIDETIAGPPGSQALAWRASAAKAPTPSTTRRWPVTNPAASDAKKLTAWATSAGVPMRPAGTEAR